LLIYFIFILSTGAANAGAHVQQSPRGQGGQGGGNVYVDDGGPFLKSIIL